MTTITSDSKGDYLFEYTVDGSSRVTGLPSQDHRRVVLAASTADEARARFDEYAASNHPEFRVTLTGEWCRLGTDA